MSRTPTLNFIHADGKTEIVPQIGGMLSYYLLYKNEGEKLEAFPPGFQMLAGDTRQRNFTLSFPDMEKSLWGFHPEETTQTNLGLKALGFNCLNYDINPPEASMYRHFLPTKEYMDAHCKDGIRAEIFFPSCWNGDIDSDNHRDHVAYPDTVNGGKCPEGFDRRVPSLFFETIWDTNHFNGKAGEFVWSNGDPTGYGYHGDFINGWKPEFLQQAIDTCTNPSGQISDCALFDIQEESEAAKCTFDVPEVLADDNCAGPADGLCGNVPIQAGPEYASKLQPGGSGTPTQGYTPPAVTERPTMPTLSYQAPKSAVTDEYGGGISVARVAEAPQESQVNAYEVKPAAEPSSSSSSSPAPSPPAVTPPPAAEAAPAKGSVISTTTYTSAGVVYEVVIEEVPVYVTVEAPAPVGRRHARHAHKHYRRDREHGLLGRGRM